MKVVGMNTGSTIIVEDLEVEDDTLEIVSIDHDDQSNVLHAIKKETDMRTVHIKT